MNFLNKIAILACIILTGCTSQLPHSNVEIPANLIRPCEPLQELAGLTGKDLLSNITANAAIYHRCDDNHNALIQAVKPKNK